MEADRRPGQAARLRLAARIRATSRASRPGTTSTSQVDPTNPKHVYLGLEEVYESTDGGATWFTIGAYWNYGIACSKGDTDPYNCPPTTHPDQHSIAFIGGQVFVGGDGGIWRRSKGAHSRRGWFNTNRTLHTLQYYGVAAGRLPGGGEAVYGGLQDNGGALLRPSAPRFVNNFTGDGGDVLVDPHNANRVVNEYVYLDMALSTNQGKNDRRDLAVVPDRGRPARSV